MMLYFSKILLATPYGHLTSTDLHSDKNLHQREVLYSPPQIDPPRISNSMVAFIVMGFLLWTHAVMADFNWTAYNMDSNNSKFYNAPPCPLASNNLGWNALKNQDGTYYTTNKRPVVIMYDSWDSAQLNAFLGQYILEAMGYRVQMVQRINYELGIEFYNDVVDLEFEIWLQDLGASFKQITQTDKVALNLGAIGYNGNYGLYIPSYLLDDHPDWNLDFFRFLYNPLHTSIFPASGTGPRLIINGQPLCDDLPGLCINATYTPPQCKPPSTRRCIELFHYDPSFATGIFQRMIDGLDLPVTLTFLGASTAEGFFREALQRREAVFMMAIVPTVFAADANLTRVLFPGNNPTQYAAFLKDSSVPLTTEPQSSLLQKLGSRRFSRDFPELETLFTKYLLPEDQINLMLKNMAVNGWTTRESSCDWFKKSQDVWGTWIPPVPKSVVSCPVGTGRYLNGATFSCITCPSGTYNWNSNNTQQCEQCPTNFECLGGSTVHVIEGLWMSNNTITPTSYICPFHEACCPDHSCPPLTCAPQFKGILCTECSHPDEYLWGEECHKCNPGGGASFYAIIFVAFLCAFVLLLLPYEEAPTVELLFFYFQVSRYVFETQVQGILKVSGISTFLAITSLNVDGFVSDCTLPISGVRKLLFRFFLPTLIILYIVVLYFVLRLLQSRFPKTNEVLMRILPHHLKGDSVSLICFRAIIIAFTFIIMPMVDSALLLLQCTTVEGRFVLTQVPQVVCSGSEHAPAAGLAIIIIILMLGVLPGLLGVVLYLLKKNDMIIYDEEGLTPLQKLFQCLYIIFKPEMFFMMPITILEKGLVSILFSTMARYSSLIQTNTYIMTLAALCGTRIYWQPFSNHLEAYLNREIALGILAMVALREYTDTYGVTAFALFEIGVAIFLPPVFHIIRWTKENYHKHRDSIHSALVSHASKLSKGGSSVHSQIQSQTQSISQAQTVTATSSRARIASTLKGSIDKLNTSSRSALRSMATSRKSMIPDEGVPLNPDKVEYSLPPS